MTSKMQQGASRAVLHAAVESPAICLSKANWRTPKPYGFDGTAEPLEVTR